VLALAFRACFGTGSPIVFPDITYSFYPVWCDFFNIPYRTYPVAEDYRICAADYAGEKGGIVLSNPNAPTSIGEDNAFLRTILDANPDCVVIVDEAYADFAASNAVSLTEAYENLLVVRSFSKSRSLAGIRIGYAIGSERLICALTAAKDSFNSYPLDSIAIAVGAAAVKADADFEEKIARVKAVRDDAAEKLRLLGFAVAPSEANFLFVGCGNAARAKALFAFLRENNILVRYFDKPRLSDHLRISVGTAQDMVQLTACVQTFVQANQ
jgi:histidinol-phosphate aminotransferase